MANIGLSKPYFARYSNTGSTVTYSNGGLLGKFTELSIELEGGDANILYADNGPAESDQQFTGGTAKMSVDDMRPDAMVNALNVKKETISDPDVKTEGASWLVFDDDQEIPYGGLGGVVKKKINGLVKWVGLVLPKIQIANPNLAFVTQGESIEWGVQELSATIMRSDAAKHQWQRLTTPLDTEEEAEKVVRAFLNITEEPDLDPVTPTGS